MFLLLPTAKTKVATAVAAVTPTSTSATTALSAQDCHRAMILTTLSTPTLLRSVARMNCFPGPTTSITLPPPSKGAAVVSVAVVLARKVERESPWWWMMTRRRRKMRIVSQVPVIRMLRKAAQQRNLGEKVETETTVAVAVLWRAVPSRN